MSRFSITQLPSGYWCVWLDDEWIEPSLPSREAAEEYVKNFKEAMK